MTDFDEIIEDLNRELRRSPYRMYYKYNGSWEIGLKDGNEIASYILLRVEGNKCIITISRTMMKFKQRHLNTCLRYVAAMIASKEGLPLVSEAMSPISLFTMLKLFDCKIVTPEGLVPQKKLSMGECKEMIAKHGHVEVYADTSDYEALVDAAFESITTIRGGTKNKKVRHGTRRIK
jgi:hypothetical protein